MPRKSIASRSRKNGLRDPVKACVTGVFCTQQTQLSISSNLPEDVDATVVDSDVGLPGHASTVNCISFVPEGI
jgi:hypothetical protein